MKVTAAHKFLTAKTILSKENGWKTLLPKHCAELMLDYESSYGSEVVSKIENDYGKRITGVILDLARTHVSNPEMNDVLFNAMRRVA
jgi:hypothetical protein